MHPIPRNQSASHAQATPRHRTGRGNGLRRYLATTLRAPPRRRARPRSRSARPDRPAEEELGQAAGHAARRASRRRPPPVRRRRAAPTRPRAARRARRGRPLPTAKPTTRFVPTAFAAVIPTPRSRTGIRIVPRITPIAPPSAPMPRPPSTAGAIRSRVRGFAWNGRTQQVDAVEDEDHGGDARAARASGRSPPK